jgi:hypothetical protein
MMYICLENPMAVDRCFQLFDKIVIFVPLFILETLSY